MMSKPISRHLIDRSLSNRPQGNRSLLGFVILPLIVFAGMTASTGEPLVILLATAVLLGAVLASRPTMLLVMVLFGGLVLSGSVALYYPPLSHLRWGVVLAALLLGLVAVISQSLQSPSSKHQALTIHVRPIYSWATMFFSVVLFSTLANLGLSLDAVVGLKGYFQVWGLLLAFAWLRLDEISMRRIGWAVLALALLQIPFALHQFLVLVPQRTTMAAARQLIVAPDIVVGTFVGSMDGGGGNVILSSLQVIGVAFLAALWRQKLLGTTKVLILASLFVVPVLLNETKVTFALLPVALFWVYRDKVKAHPIQTIVAAVAFVLLLWTLALVYTSLPRAQWQTFKSPEEYLEKTLAYNFGDRGYGGFVLNRTTVYGHWLDHHGLNDITHALIGHGAGETNEGGQGLRKSSIAMNQYSGMGIGLTGLSALLWETGILGAVSALGFFLSVFLAACRLEHSAPDSHSWAMMKAVQAGMLVMGINLLHNNYFVFEIGFQTLLLLLVGTTILQARQLSGTTAS